jgi:diacylglycerol kinase family enzyme
VASNSHIDSEFVSPIVALCPLGTGNALFHSLHKTSDEASIYIQALRTLIRGAPKTLPIFQAKFSPGARLLTNEAQTATPLHNDVLFGAVVASYGLHATLVADSDTTEWRKHGDKRFGLVAESLLSPPDGGLPHAYRADVTLRRGDEQRISRDEHGYVLLTLVSNLEKTFTISPESKPLDGTPRVVHFGPLDGKEVMSIMGGAYQGGQHIKSEVVGYDAVEGMKISFREPGDDWRWRRCCIDGSIVAVEEGGWMDVSMTNGQVLQVVVDAQTTT